MNFLVIWLLWEILDKSRKMQESEEAYRKTEGQLVQYRDMQAVYKWQGISMIFKVGDMSGMRADLLNGMKLIL